ncbi:zinc finger protein Noc isoform X2 [Culicoides brevitarsis]|uniref:zinc finger protein Noc isoform X2 n=1 Tax=Culicoides brevitarsis TaxID=469753 RepID=UPI00307BEEE8
MVVLDKSEMLTIGNNQYLQPDYLAPSNSVIDSKKSPLALLAQTCSQIGADSSSLKPIVLDKTNKQQKSETSRSPTGLINNNTIIKNGEKTNNNNSASPELKLAFKPYEANVLTRKLSNSNTQDDASNRPSSKNSANGNNNSEQDNAKNLSTKRVPSRSSSGSPVNSKNIVDVVENGKSTPGSSNGSERKSSGSPNEKGASPIIRSGMEVLHGSPKDYGAYQKALGMGALGALYPGMEANPAFRNPYAGISHHHAAMLAAAASYSGAAAQQQSAQQTPFMSYARVKTPSGGEALVPVCKDPYCTGCQYSAHNQQLLMGQPCPQGCTQCEHQKLGLAMAMSSLPPGHPYASAMNRQPYVCSWIMGGQYCGKRFETSDELFSHLRSHSPSLADPATAAATLAAQQNAALMNPLSNLYRAYANPPLSPLSAARYHPYAKPGALPPTFTAGSPYSAFNPAALGPYAAYSPYAAAALYSQRMGAAHP